MDFTKFGGFLRTVSLEDGDRILTLGRMNDGATVTLSTRNGGGWTVDPGQEDVIPVESPVPLDQENAVTFPVGSDYVWVLTRDGFIGRNKAPPDSNGDVDIGKVSLDGAVSEVEYLKPLAASEAQIYFRDGSELLICTFADAVIKLRKIPLPDGVPESRILGAGPVGQPESAERFWVASAAKAYFFDGSGWSSRVITLPPEEQSVTALSMHIADETLRLSGPVAVLFGASNLGVMPPGEATETQSEAPQGADAGDEAQTEAP